MEIKNIQETIQDLKNKLQKAVKAEKYEEAAVLRDKIKELESRNP
jgi:protein-arginine kinase activator protein McsA